MSARFRPTLWPGTVIVPPRLRPLPDVEVDGDWILWRIAPPRLDPVELPTDFYLHELLDTKPDDLEAVAALVHVPTGRCLTSTARISTSRHATGSTTFRRNPMTTRDIGGPVIIGARSKSISPRHTRRSRPGSPYRQTAV